MNRAQRELLVALRDSCGRWTELDSHSSTMLESRAMRATIIPPRPYASAEKFSDGSWRVRLTMAGILEGLRLAEIQEPAEDSPSPNRD